MLTYLCTYIHEFVPTFACFCFRLVSASHTYLTSTYIVEISVHYHCILKTMALACQNAYVAKDFCQYKKASACVYWYQSHIQPTGGIIFILVGVFTTSTMVARTLLALLFVAVAFSAFLLETAEARPSYYQPFGSVENFYPYHFSNTYGLTRNHGGLFQNYY